MAQYTQQQATDAVLLSNEILTQINAEATGIVAVNQQLQDALAAAGGPGGTITDDLANAIKANNTAINAITEILPDVPKPEGK